MEVTHGTFRPRNHRFYIESDELGALVRCGIPVNLAEVGSRRVFHPQMTVHEEKQTDVMLACSVVLDAALGRQGAAAPVLCQAPPLHHTNTRPSPARCHAAIVLSADIDLLPAAEMAAKLFDCPAAIAFSFPHRGYRPGDLVS